MFSAGTRIYFRLTEILDTNTQVKLNDEVEFTLSPDTSTSGRLQAIRIKFIPNGTIMKNLLAPKRTSTFDGVHGVHMLNEQGDVAPLIDLNSELPAPMPNSKALEHVYQANGPARTDSWSEILSQMQIPITSTNNNSAPTANGEPDLLSTPVDGGDLSAANENSATRNRRDEANRSNIRNGMKQTFKGFIATLKESYGFIENEDHKTEVFFHFR